MISTDDYLSFLDEGFDDICRIVRDPDDELANHSLDAEGWNSPCCNLDH